MESEGVVELGEDMKLEGDVSVGSELEEERGGVGEIRPTVSVGGKTSYNIKEMSRV